MWKSIPAQEVASTQSLHVEQHGPECHSCCIDIIRLVKNPKYIPAKYTVFPGIIPGFSISRYPGISAKYTGLSRVSASPPGIPELVLSIPGIGDYSRVSASPPGIPELSPCSTRTCTSCDVHITVQYSRLADEEALLFSRMKKNFRIIFSDFLAILG